MTMNQQTVKKQRVLVWLPRVLGILFIIGISIFAFDEPILSVGFVIHLIPSLVLVILLITAWRSACVGGILFMVVGLASLFLFHTYQHIAGFLVVSLPPIVIGTLFLVSWYQQRKR